MLKIKTKKFEYIFKNLTLKFLKKSLQIIRKGGFKSWPTKSYDIWFFLQYILIKERPEKLVEFGSGKSTYYLAEYSQKCNKIFYSIEQNFIYLIRTWLGLRCSFLKNFRLIFAPIKGDWFDIKKLESIKNFKNADFLFIDGPGGALNKGSRNSKKGLHFLKEFYPDSPTIIIDDLQRKDIKKFTNEFISQRKDFFYLLFTYTVDTHHEMNNLILFCVRKKYKNDYLEFLEFTKIKKSLFFKADLFDDLFKFLVNHKHSLEK